MKHYAGKGCKCEAWSYSECCCVGVDWRSAREVELEEKLKSLMCETCRGHIKGVCENNGFMYGKVTPKDFGCIHHKQKGKPMRLTEDEKEELTTLLNEAGERGEEKVHKDLLIFHAKALGVGEAIEILEKLFNRGE